MITVKTDDLDTEELALKAIDAGAEDVSIEYDSVVIYTKPDGLEKVRTILEQENIPVASAELSMVPKTTLELEEKLALQTLRLVDKLEELDEIRNVSSNVNLTESVLEKYQEQA